MRYYLFILLFLSFAGCGNARTNAARINPVEQPAVEQPATLRTGAERTEMYFPKLASYKNIAVVANQTSRIGEVHLVDSLVGAGFPIRKVFSPEHGFRGTADAGAIIDNSIDKKTNLPIVSLYGSNKKPTVAQLKGIDLVVFDLQDVGVRFYTYISTLTYVMEACAENGIDVLVLDRPNPNGFYVDGPTLEPGYTSFVGMHPIPVVHGMTMAEYARMVNGEGWLAKGMGCSLSWVENEGYDHKTLYALPVNPSPNLKDMDAIYLYPSVCFFEGTDVSLGRGTEAPFTMIGHPVLKNKPHRFTPRSMAGATNPPQKDKVCYGYNLHPEADKLLKSPGLNLSWLISFYRELSPTHKYFNDYFDKLAGTDKLRKQIIAGKTEKEIKASWQADLTRFKQMRKKYLLYPDFE